MYVDALRLYDDAEGPRQRRRFDRLGEAGPRQSTPKGSGDFEGGRAHRVVLFARREEKFVHWTSTMYLSRPQSPFGGAVRTQKINGMTM